jgi:AcrR family transcriptional regulator
MRRAEKRIEIKKKIMDVSLELFLSQGYKGTTIRQIIEKADINIGTLYHFFRDKEDINVHIAQETYDKFIDYADHIVENEKDYILRYALTRALEFKAIEKYDRVAELYLETYSSWRITQMVLPVNIARSKLFFHQYNRGLSEQDYLNKTLALRGMRLMFISERVYNGPGSYETNCPFLIETALTLYNVPKKNIEKAITKAMKIVSEDLAIVYGITI